MQDWFFFVPVWKRKQQLQLRDWWCLFFSWGLFVCAIYSYSYHHVHVPVCDVLYAWWCFNVRFVGSLLFLCVGGIPYLSVLEQRDSSIGWRQQHIAAEVFSGPKWLSDSGNQGHRRGCQHKTWIHLQVHVVVWWGSHRECVWREEIKTERERRKRDRDRERERATELCECECKRNPEHVAAFLNQRKLEGKNQTAFAFLCAPVEKAKEANKDKLGKARNVAISAISASKCQMPQIPKLFVKTLPESPFAFSLPVVMSALNPIDSQKNAHIRLLLCVMYVPTLPL